MIIEQFGCIPFGGDYCPEQWDEAQSVMQKILDHLEIPYKIGIPS